MKKSVIIAVCGALTVLVSSCVQQAENTDGTAFTVNGKPVLEEQFETYKSLRIESNPYITDEEIIDSYVRQKVIEQEAKRRGITASDEEIDTLIENSFAALEQDETAYAAVQEYAQEYGMTLEEYKEQSRESYKQAVLGEKLRAELEAEAADSGILPANYYEEYIDNLVKNAEIEYK